MTSLTTEPMVPWNGYIVTNNPLGVQAVLYKYGYPPAANLDEMFEMTNELLAQEPVKFKNDLLSAHPDKEMLNSSYSSHTHNKSNFSVCNLCKSNFTGSDALAYRELMQGNTPDMIFNELQNVIAAFNNAPDAQTKNDAAFKAMILGDLLSQTDLTGWQIPPEIATYFNQNVAPQAGQSSSTSDNNNMQPQAMKYKFSLHNLSRRQKAIGFVAIGIFAGTLITLLVSKHDSGS